MEHLFDEIRAERAYQDELWGYVFDDKNTINDWQVFVSQQMSRATKMAATPAVQRERILKAATVLVAALQAFDRNGGFPLRHYDSPPESDPEATGE